MTIDIAWDVEHPMPDIGQYHIYAAAGPLEEFQSLEFSFLAPETPENDADVRAIVEALERISARLRGNK